MKATDLEIIMHGKPELKSPVMVVGWPGMGLLAKITAEYLQRELDAQLFAEIHSYGTNIFYRDGVLQAAPLGHRFYSHPEGDLVICIGDDQPKTSIDAYNLMERVMVVAEEVKVKRIFSIAAFLGLGRREQRIFGIVNMLDLQGYLSGFNVEVARGEGNIVGLNGLIIEAAKRRGIEGICLLGPIEQAQIPQPGAARKVLEVLMRMLGVKVELKKLEEQQAEIDESIRKRMEEMKRAERKRREDLQYIG